MADHFQRKIEAWRDSFYLLTLSTLSGKEYDEIFGKLNTDVPFDLFHRNVSIALKKAEDLVLKTNE